MQLQTTTVVGPHVSTHSEARCLRAHFGISDLHGVAHARSRYSGWADLFFASTPDTAASGRDIVGSVVKSLMEDGSLASLGDSVEEQLENLWSEGRAWATCTGRPWSNRVWDRNVLHMPANGCRYPYLDEVVKAGNVGVILRFLQDFCASRAPVDTEEQRLRAVLMWACVDWLWLMRHNDLLLSDEVAGRAGPLAFCALDVGRLGIPVSVSLDVHAIAPSQPVW
jgi:hypothetical protein